MAFREFQVFAKPVGPLCNLGCDYCYYLGKKQLFGKEVPSRMTLDLLDVYIRQHIEATTEPVIFFSWHGGEPVLAGLDFYRSVVYLQEKYCPVGKKIINGLQTNGTLLDEEWALFLAKHGFIVGISLDGPEHLHDRFRKGRNGQGTFREALRGYDLLLLQGIDPEILCVVNAENVRQPLSVYRFFKELGVKYLTFLPLVERMSDRPGGVSHHTVTADSFGDFLCAVFDEWVEADIGRLKIQIIEEALRTVFHQGHTLCIFRPVCGGVPVLEHTGDFYSCDHYVDPGHRVGNIRETALAALLDSDQQRAFGLSKQTSLPRYCLDCPVLNMCNGECPKNRFITTPGGEPGLNYLCTGYQKFFSHIKPFAEAVSSVK
jgi:uncharacterized protein